MPHWSSSMVYPLLPSSTCTIFFFWNPWPCDQSWLYHSSPLVIKTFDTLPLVQWTHFSRHSLCCASKLCVHHMLSSYRDGSCWPIGGLLCWVPVQPHRMFSLVGTGFLLFHIKQHLFFKISFQCHILHGMLSAYPGLFYDLVLSVSRLLLTFHCSACTIR